MSEDRSRIPEAWPLLLCREQLAAYLGMSAETIRRICPVAPLDLGVNLVRWRRPDIDAWVAGLPARLVRGAHGVATPAPTPSRAASEERRLSAVERARDRAANLEKKVWQKKKR
jgi:predicted DNA-binding transcriptional regulator AlpA